MARKLFTGSTGRGQGKTTISLGLIEAARQAGEWAAYIKPVGRGWVDADGRRVDEGSALVASVFDLNVETAKRST